jgi:hypothetical protein
MLLLFFSLYTTKIRLSFPQGRKSMSDLAGSVTGVDPAGTTHVEPFIFYRVLSFDFGHF